MRSSTSPSHESLVVPPRSSSPLRNEAHLIVAGRGVRRLTRAELPVGTAKLARYLIGKILVRDDPRGRTSGRIVETEAYVPGDAAGHAYIGRTPRNRSLFLERGHAYVYFIYGCWFALNVSGEAHGVGGGALLRALVPIEGIDLMRKRRGAERLVDLARGPGRLATAMAIDRSLDGVDLTAHSLLWLADDGGRVPRIGVTTRIGLSREAHRPLRFYSRSPRDLPYVSGPRRVLGP